MFEYHARYKAYPTEIKSSCEIEQLLEIRNHVFERLNIDNDLLSDEFPRYFYPLKFNTKIKVLKNYLG